MRKVWNKAYPNKSVQKSVVRNGRIRRIWTDGKHHYVKNGKTFTKIKIRR